MWNKSLFYWYIKFTSKLISSLKTNIIAFKTLKIKKNQKNTENSSTYLNQKTGNLTILYNNSCFSDNVPKIYQRT